MAISPSSLDIWLVQFLAGFLARHPLFDQFVQSGIRHNVLGGFVYAAALFVLWAQVRRDGRSDIRIRLLTTIAGSVLTILMTMLAGLLLAWPPPCQQLQAARLFPWYMECNSNPSCFPSQSTSLYGSVAAGVISLHRIVGALLWLGVPILVSLPRMYVGGHYFTDVAVGVMLSLAGYGVARFLLERPIISRIDAWIHDRRRLVTLLDLGVFFWILQLAIEFKDVVWVARSVPELLK